MPHGGGVLREESSNVVSKESFRERQTGARTCLTLVLVLCRVILGRNDQTTTLTSATENGLDNVDQLLFALQCPVDLVVVSCAQIHHDVLVAEEEHGRARVVQLVHFVKVGHLSDIDQVDNGKVLDLLGDRVEELVHLHAGWVPVGAEAEDNDTVLFRKDGLINLPAVCEMWKEIRLYVVYSQISRNILVFCCFFVTLMPA